MDNLTPEKRSKVMRGVKGKNTKPELLVRRTLHRLGYRFRVHGAGIIGTPDIVFKARKKVIFVHGCFWHQHPSIKCKDSRRPASNIMYWNEKLDRNIARDKVALEEIATAAWQSLVIWECETKDQAALTHQLTNFLGPTIFSK